MCVNLRTEVAGFFRSIFFQIESQHFLLLLGLHWLKTDCTLCCLFFSWIFFQRLSRVANMVLTPRRKYIDGKKSQFYHSGDFLHPSLVGEVCPKLSHRIHGNGIFTFDTTIKIDQMQAMHSNTWDSMGMTCGVMWFNLILHIKVNLPSIPKKGHCLSLSQWPITGKTSWCISDDRNYTLQGTNITNISPEKSILKIIFLFPRWDMLISWRVSCILIMVRNRIAIMNIYPFWVIDNTNDDNQHDIQMLQLLFHTP